MSTSMYIEMGEVIIGNSIVFIPTYETFILSPIVTLISKFPSKSVTTPDSFPII